MDDDEDIRTIVGMSLSLDPFITFRSVGSSAEAMAFWESGYRPDVVLIDARLPGLSGLDLLAHFRRCKDHESILFVFLTAAVRPHEVAEFLEAGATAVISKPFDPLDLARTVRRLASGKSTG